MMRRRMVRKETKVSRTISLRKVPASLKTRSLRGILKRLLRNLRKSTLSLVIMSMTARYRGSSLLRRKL